MWSTIAASVDVRPDPASPHTRTNPDVASARRVAAAGQPERVDRRDAGHDAPQHEADDAALAERADPEPAEALHRVHGVDLVLVAQRTVGATERAARAASLGVGRLDHVERRLDERAVDPQVGPGADLQVDVGRALLDGEPQQPIEIQHAAGIDRRMRPALDPRRFGALRSRGEQVAQRSAAASTTVGPGPPRRGRLGGPARLTEEDGQRRGDAVAEGVEVVAALEEHDRRPGRARAPATRPASARVVAGRQRRGR